MSDDTLSSDSRAVSGTRITDLPEYPGEFPKQHDALDWDKKVRARLGTLVAVAEGKTPAAARQIVDINIDEFPPLPRDHPDHSRRHAERYRSKGAEVVQSL